MLTTLEWPAEQSSTIIDLKLDRLRTLLQALDNPQNKLPQIIHVAGTNGKGSTCAFLQAILRAHGFKTHGFRSPHLRYWNERYILQDRLISDEELLAAIRLCKHTAEKNNIEITHFEALTALAFIAFSKLPADFVILEVGLGGRLDATNIVEDKICSVITSLGLDHTEFLGNTIEEIASEKAHIMSQGRPCFTSVTASDPLGVIREVASKTGCNLFSAEKDWQLAKSDDQKHVHIRITNRDEQIEYSVNPELLPLAGEHQLENLALALATATIGLDLATDETTLQKALSLVSWPARLQPLFSGKIQSVLKCSPKIFIDVAHNAAAAQSLALWLLQGDHNKVHIAVKLTRNRSYTDFIRPFEKLTVPVDIYVPEGHDQNISTKVPVHEFGDFSELLELMSEKDLAESTVLFCGSHNLVAETCAYNEDEQ